MTILGHTQRGGTLRSTSIVRVSLDEALAEPKLLDTELWATAEVFFG
jgi:hypothetical protein